MSPASLSSTHSRPDSHAAVSYESDKGQRVCFVINCPLILGSAASPPRPYTRHGQADTGCLSGSRYFLSAHVRMRHRGDGAGKTQAEPSNGKALTAEAGPRPPTSAPSPQLASHYRPDDAISSSSAFSICSALRSSWDY